MIRPDAASAPRRTEFFAGVRAQAPLLLGVAPFGLAYGAYAVNTGRSAGLAQAMSAIVFGGASQFVAVRLMANDVPGGIIVLTTLLVNMRHMLYSAALAPPASCTWLAAGDAALAFDPLSSQGLFNALYTGLAGAEAADRHLAGDPDALPGYAASVATIHDAYRRHLTAWYEGELRFGEHLFWRRRHGGGVA